MFKVYSKTSKISLRQFRIQLINYQNLPQCQGCSCRLNVSDGLYVRKYKKKFIKLYFWNLF